MLNGLMSLNGLHFLFRFAHLFFALIWVGLLYYLNFVQGAVMAEADSALKTQITQRLLPKVMWWFRYGALGTFVFGALMLGLKAHMEHEAGGVVSWNTPYWINILSGSALATLMFLNVWLVIWPRQRAVIASSLSVSSGGAADPSTASQGARSTVASRTNVAFSIPMIFFMGSASHLGYLVSDASQIYLYWILFLAVAGAVELNALKGRLGPLVSVRGVITCGFALTILFVALNRVTI